MNILDKLLKYQNGLVFVTVHWLLAIYLLIAWKMKTTPRFGEEPWDFQETLSGILVILDAPAMSLSFIVCYPLESLGIISDQNFIYLTCFVSVFAVTFQWLIIGRIIVNTFGSFESRMTKISLKDG